VRFEKVGWGSTKRSQSGFGNLPDVALLMTFV
jgi:hypothetical protein